MPMRICQIILGVIATLWLLALVLMVIGVFGLFGQEADPLGAGLMVILGQPWVRAIDLAPEPAWPLLLALAPGLNLALAFLACHALNRKTK